MIIINNYLTINSLAQTCKSFNGSIWSLITTLDEEDFKNIEEPISLHRFNNLQSVSFSYHATIIPQDLTKLTTLQKIDANINLNLHEVIECLFRAIRTLTNLRELNVLYHKFSEMDDLLIAHKRLTKLEISAQGFNQSGTQKSTLQRSLLNLINF